ncbi:eIF5-mimic protein 1-like [Tubulanus polymorphus]|uniref:eIF5-mimic protein 1-like n=1 Tax=Tubulanus polymorphus TaxID=672921 RepID=UPI003DA2E5B4
MSQKAAKPILSGQRIKTRKRDEKDKIKQDPSAFRDSIIEGLNNAGKEDFEAINQFLDSAGSKLDYRRYAEPLFDVLFAGGLLAPGGAVIEDSNAEKSRTEVCVFFAKDEVDILKEWYDVFWKLIRHYKYLEKAFEEEMKKILKCVKGYTPEERLKLAKICALFFSNNLISAQCLRYLQEDNLVKEGLALKFVTDLFHYWMKEKKDIKEIKSTLKAGQMEAKLMNFFPSNKQTIEHFEKHFKEHDLDAIVEIQRSYELNVMKKKLKEHVEEMIHDEEPVKEIIAFVKEQMKKTAKLVEHDLVVQMWNCIMEACEWNKKEELVAGQALKHLKIYAPLLEALANTARSEMTLMLKIQEFCYENMNFMKVFQKIIILLYKARVLSEDAIIRWYKNSSESRGAFSSKGLSVFLDDMKQFVHWLENAEEESSEEEDEDDEEEK